MSPDELIETAGFEHLKELARQHYLVATEANKLNDMDGCGIMLSDIIRGNTVRRNEASRLFNKAYARLMKLDPNAPKCEFLPEN